MDWQPLREECDHRPESWEPITYAHAHAQGRPSGRPPGVQKEVAGMDAHCSPERKTWTPRASSVFAGIGKLTQTLRENLELCSWDEILHSSRNELDLYVPLWIGLNVLMCKQEDGSVLINVRGTIHVSESTHTCTLAHTRTSTACCLLTLVYVVTVEKLGLKDLYTQCTTAAARGRGNGMGRGTDLPVIATSFVKNKSISQNDNKQMFVHSKW